MTIRIGIIDDHAVVRQGLRFFLSQQQDIEIVGEAATAAQALELARTVTIDVLLLDLLLPGAENKEIIAQLRDISPKIRIIVLTSYHSDAKVLAAIKAGACSYLLKDITPTDLIMAIRAAARGESTLHTLAAASVIRDVRQPKRSALDTLTIREKEVLLCIARGRTNRSIAQDLLLGEQTVKTHVSNILSKLQLADRTQAAIYALQEGLIPLSDALKHTTIEDDDVKEIR